MNMGLRERMAERLGWSESDAAGFSLPSLAALVRPVDRELAEEVTRSMESGAHLLVRGRAARPGKRHFAAARGV